MKHKNIDIPDANLNKKATLNNESHSSSKLTIVMRVLIIIVWIAMMVMIAWFSSKPADESTKQSNAVGTVICKIVIKDFKTFTQAVKQYYIQRADKIVRKSAHFFEYAVLGAITCATFNYSLRNIFAGIISSRLFSKHPRFGYTIRVIITPLLWCFLYAITDEIHQYYVAGRYASFTDVLIDTSGSAFGLLILLLIIAIVKRIRNRIKKEK